MLSRYRSVSGLALPRTSRACRTGNPVATFEENVEFRRQRLKERFAADGGTGGCPLQTALRLWDGPLAGVAHMAGQFTAIEEGPAGEDAPQAPPDLAGALCQDLDALVSLAELTQDIMYDASSSESDFAVVPVILEPRLTAGASGGAAAASGTAVKPRTVGDDAEVVAGGSGGDGGGGWWSVAEAKAAPLTWSEVATSLGIAPELAARMEPPREFGSEDAFWGCMMERHISKLEGGEQLRLSGPPAEAAANVCKGGDELSEPAVMPTPLSSAAALAAAVRQLSGVVSYPVLQVTVGSEALGWNPIPLMWLGRSARSGAVLGLLTAVVWT